MKKAVGNQTSKTLLTCAVLACAAAANAGLAIVNGDFEHNAPPAGTVVADVEDWYDRNVNPGDPYSSTWYGSQYSPNGTSVMGLSWDGNEGHWGYQNIGVNDGRFLVLEIQFDLGSFIDVGIGIEVAVYQGNWAGAADDVDIDGNATLIDSAQVTTMWTVGPMETVTATLDLASANTTDPLWLRFINFDIGAGAPWAMVDNVSIVSGPVDRPVITEVMMTGSGLYLEGTNGPANGAYRVLRSPDLTLPMEVWSDIGVHTFDAAGAFNVTDTDTEEESQFYGLRVISAVPVYPPVITTDPQDVGILVGDDAVFNVTATGDSPLTYRWFFNTNTLIASGSDNTLVITNAQLADSGTISATVSNLFGVAQSDFATLLVTNSPPFILTQPSSHDVATGMYATFMVEAGGSLPLHYQWYYNTNTALAGETNTTLPLNDVQLTNAGKYSVTITNNFGSVTSDYAELTVSTSLGPIGWATVSGGTTGGAGGTTQTVSTAGAFISAIGASDARVIFVDGLIDINGSGTGSANINSHKTIIGLGSNAQISGQLEISGKQNVILQNLSISNNGTAGQLDGLRIVNGSHHVWVDHCMFVDCSDGSLDTTVGSDYVTVSWCKFMYVNQENHNFVNLIGASDTDVGNYRVTFHHNMWTTGCDERMPRVRFGRVHVFNNYYYIPGHLGGCIRAAFSSEVLVENNYFENCRAPYQAEDGGKLKATGNIMVDTYGPLTGGSDTVFTPPYAYTLGDPAMARVNIIAGAGNTF